MEADLSALNQQLKQLSADVALLKAQQRRGQAPTNPWLPLKEAAARLNFPSARALRNRIKTGQFPPDCVRQDPTATGKAVKYLVHVERYITLLR
mgnify:CR=1 FL=1